MKAACYEQTGPAAQVLQLVDLPDPQPGAGEVRVRLQWSGVNPSDVKSRAGLRSKAMPFPRVTPHSDGAGVIDQVGDGVPESRIGEPVWVWNAAWGRPNGTAAEYVTLPARQAVRLPDGVPADAGACFGIPALTALHAVQGFGGVRGRTVLVAGGAGAVGHYAVQFARLLGARRVLATVSSDAKGELARQGGAEAVIDYRREDVAARVLALTHGHGVDRVIEVDAAANARLDAEVVAKEGDIVVYGSGAPEFAVPFFPMIVRNLTLRCFMVYHLADSDRARAEATLERLLGEGRLLHNVAERVPLSEIARAHELVESGRVAGNVVLSVGA
jgi:NADPH2:quinone reductase